MNYTYVLWPTCISHTLTDHWMCSVKVGTIMESVQCIINLSPRQLFVSGTLQLRNSGQAAVDFFDNTQPDYGIDYEESEAHNEHRFYS